MRLFVEQNLNKLIYFVFNIILLALSFYYIYYLILLIIYNIFLIYKKIYNIFFIIINILFFSYFIISYCSNTKELFITNKTIDVLESKNVSICKYNNNLYVIKKKLTPGKYRVSGIILKLKKKSYEGDFSEFLFYRSRGIKGIIRVKKLEYIKNIITRYSIRNMIYSFYEKRIKSNFFPFFSSILFGKNYFSKKDNNIFKNLNMLFFISLSGYFINLIFKIISYIVFRLTRRIIISRYISILLMFILYIMLGFNNSLLKLLLFVILNELNNKFQLMSKIDIFSIVFIMFLIKNPLFIYNTFFIYSFLGSFISIFLGKNEKYKNLNRNLFYTFISFPYLTHLTNSISPLFIFNFIFIKIINIVFIPMVIITMFIPYLNGLFGLMWESFLYVLNHNSNILVIDLIYFKDYLALIYYIMSFILFLTRNKKIYIFLAFLLIVYFFNLTPSINKVVFLDCNEGNCCHILYNKKHYLIDCFNSYNYLQKNGITEIEAILITHSDNDHFGDLNEICKNIKVKCIYISIYDKSFMSKFEQNNANIVFLKAFDKINLFDQNIEIISPKKEYSKINDNSLVFKVKFLKYNILFTGDISNINIHELMPYISDVNFIHIPHHGAKSELNYDL